MKNKPFCSCGHGIEVGRVTQWDDEFNGRIYLTLCQRCFKPLGQWNKLRPKGTFVCEHGHWVCKECWDNEK